MKMCEEEIKNSWKQAVSSEWRNGDLFLYSEDGDLVNIYRDFDLESVAIDNHNEHVAKKRILNEKKVKK